jgi:hypothetical protein
MDKAKRARTAETPKQPSLVLMLRAPCLYPDPLNFPDYVAGGSGPTAADELLSRDGRVWRLS